MPSSRALRVSSVIIGSGVAIAGGGGLIRAAVDSFTGYRGSFYPWDVIQPSIGAVLVLALAALIMAPERVYNKSPIRTVGFIFGIILALGGIYFTVMSILLYIGLHGHEDMRGADLITGGIGLLALASTAVLLIKSLRARRRTAL